MGEIKSLYPGLSGVITRSHPQRGIVGKFSQNPWHALEDESLIKRVGKGAALGNR